MNDSHKQLYHDYLRLTHFASRLLNPDDLGFSVSEEIRDAAREAIGIPKIADKHTSDVYSEVQQAEFNERDR